MNAVTTTLTGRGSSTPTGGPASSLAPIWAWFRLDLRRRRRSLAVLAVLIAVASGMVTATLAGARRGESAVERLQDRTLPATSVVLANTPGFDWEPIRRLPNVEALTTFVLGDGSTFEGLPDVMTGFPPADDEFMRTIERPVVLAGRRLDPTRADEVVISPGLAESFGKKLGDQVVIHLPTPQELRAGSGQGPLHGPTVRARIVGIVVSPWLSDAPGSVGGLQVSPGLAAAYPANVVNPDGYINAMVRLRGGESAITQFRTDFATATGRSDIDIWNMHAQGRDVQRHITFESQSLLAFAAAVFLASLFLVGQTVLRYAASSTVELQTMRALGMTPRQAVATAAAGPVVAGVVGGGLGVVGAFAASTRFPFGTAAAFEPSPGLSADWAVFGGLWLLAVVLVTVAAVAAASLALGTAHRDVAPGRSAVVALLARGRTPVPVLVGSRLALEPGSGRTAVPVRPALLGAVIGVLGVLAAFTFSHGVSDAAANPERFGQTFQLVGWLGLNGQDEAPVDRIRPVVAADPDVTGVNDGRTAVATVPDGSATVSLWSYGTGPKSLPAVVLAGRLPAAADEVLLAPRTLTALHAKVGDRVRLVADKGPMSFTVSGSGFVPLGPHNGYADGGWITSAGFDSMFDGYKFRFLLVSVRPGVDPTAAGKALSASVVAAVPEAEGFGLDLTQPPPEVAALRQAEVLPVVLGGFLALLAVGAVGHALATAVRRRSHDIAVLRALGMTRWQSRGVVATQASVLAVVGLVFGVPLGLALGRMLWRVVADYTPVQYVPPVAFWTLLTVGPLALLAANLLAAWPGHRAARMRIGHVLRAE